MHNNHKEIAILLATYNGEEYLGEQINSLYAQTEHGFTLYIHDDGSTDTSIEIINQYASRYNNIVIMEDPVKNRGARDSFIWMLENVNSQYYMFCDQDDVWMPNKIEVTLNAMKDAERITAKIPIVVATDLTVVDRDLKTIFPSLWKATKANTKLSVRFKYLSVSIIAYGCTMMLNEPAKQVSLPISPKASMYDSWISMKVVSSSGRIICVDIPTIFYRRHSNTTTNSAKGILNVDVFYFIKKLCSLKKVIKDNKIHLDMVNAIEKTSVFVYLWRKFLYHILR
jgi:glycosyltransferase involved in cell wall biosynthesis